MSQQEIINAIKQKLSAIEVELAECRKILKGEKQ